MAPRSVEICVVTRAYGGAEGRRVKAGTRFAIDQEREGLQVISRARFQQLRDARLVKPFGAEDAAAAPGAATYAARTPRTLDGKPLTESTPGGPGEKGPRATRAAARRRTQEAAPEAPAPLSPRAGSPTGAGKPSSASPEGQASGGSTSGRRGTRRGSSPSPSTTHTR